MEIRPLDEGDVSVCVEIFFDAMDELHRRMHFPLEDSTNDGWLYEALRHLRATDPNATALASLEGEPFAFGCAYRRQGYWFLAFLFVRPRTQAQGVGRAILEHLLPSETPGPVTLATAVESFQSVSTGLYARYGIAPRTPIYRLSGIKTVNALPSLPGDVQSEHMTQASIGDCTVLDRSVLGYKRPQDHAAWLGWNATAMVYRHGSGRLLGYGYVDPLDGIGPIASEDQRLSAAIVRDLTDRLSSPDRASLAVFGSSDVLLAALLDAGMRIGEAGSAPYVYCSTDARKPKPSYVGYRVFLM